MAASAHALMVKVLPVQLEPLAGPWISKWCGGVTHAALLTVIVHARLLVPVGSVHRNAPVAATLALTPRVAVPALPAAQFRFTVGLGAEGRMLTLGGDCATLVTPAPVTVSRAVIGEVSAGEELARRMLAAGQGLVAEEQAIRATGSAHWVAAPSCRIS